MLSELEYALGYEEDEVWLGEVNRRSRDYIRWVQRSLNRIIGAGLIVDGIRGRHTRRAIRLFQRQQGLKVDGIVGRRTQAALIAAGASPPSKTTRRPMGTKITPVSMTSITSRHQVPTLLSRSELRHAARQNQQLANRLGWSVLYDAIASWILNFVNMSPGPELFTQAVANWQRQKGLTADGILDYHTWQAMLRDTKAGIPTYQTPEGVTRPHGLRAIVTTFGDPTKPDWKSRNTILIRAPAGRSFSGRVKEHRVHRLLAPHFQRLFAAIARESLWNEISPTSGTFYCRTKSTSSVGKQPCGSPGIRFNQLSTHSWGITIDIRARDYPFYTRRKSNAGAPLRYPPPTIARLFQEHGFHWGLWFMNGRLKNGHINFTGADPHHFQFATGY